MKPWDPAARRLLVGALRDDIDTDQIVPARFLRTTSRVGLGRHLFADTPGWRLAEPTKGGFALVAGANFGCGSSREHAVWSLMEAGIEAVIAPSFADIFQQNALKNGLVPAAVDPRAHAALCAALGRAEQVQIDLAAARIATDSGESFAFDIEPFARENLRRGWTDLDYLLSQVAAIGAYEGRL